MKLNTSNNISWYSSILLKKMPLNCFLEWKWRNTSNVLFVTFNDQKYSSRVPGDAFDTLESEFDFFILFEYAFHVLYFKVKSTDFKGSPLDRTNYNE